MEREWFRRFSVTGAGCGKFLRCVVCSECSVCLWRFSVRSGSIQHVMVSPVVVVSFGYVATSLTVSGSKAVNMV